jgi:hypothetical protein
MTSETFSFYYDPVQLAAGKFINISVPSFQYLVSCLVKENILTITSILRRVLLTKVTYFRHY